MTGITVGSYVKRSRSPVRRFLLEVAVDVGAGGISIGQVGNRCLVKKDSFVIPGPQGGGRIPLQAVSHVNDIILVAEVGG